MKNSKITFNIELDDNNVPESINWKATDFEKDEAIESKSLMISLWDPNEKNTMRIDLWTKDMPVDEMHAHFFQTLVTMAESFEQATGNTEIVKEMTDFCESFARKTPYFKEPEKN
jgi:gliding motility-associated protein GldC